METTGPRPTGDAELHLDLDAFVPRPAGTVTFQRQRYDVRAVIDLPMQEYFDLLQLDRELASATDEETILRGAMKKVRMLVPDMPEGVVAQLSYTQALRVAAAAWTIAKPNPPAAAAGSSSGSPASADSGAAGAGAS